MAGMWVPGDDLRTIVYVNRRIVVRDPKEAIGKEEGAVCITSYTGEDLGVLAKNSSMNELVLRCKKTLVTNLCGIEKLTQLRQLVLTDFYGSLTPLKELTELNSLTITGRFCDELVIPPKVKHLSIEGEFDRPLLSLKGHKLEELQLNGQFNQSLEPLRDCPNLRTVTIKGKFAFSLWPLVHTKCDSLQLNHKEVVGEEAVVDFIGCGYPIIPPVDYEIRYLKSDEEVIKKFRKEIDELEVEVCLKIYESETESKTETKAKTEVESGDESGQIYERLDIMRKAVTIRRFELESDFNPSRPLFNNTWRHKMIMETILFNLLIQKMHYRLDLAKAKRGLDDKSESDIRKMTMYIIFLDGRIKSQEGVLEADNIILESVRGPEEEKKVLIKEETEAAQKRKDYRRANPETSIWEMKTVGEWPEGW